MKQLNPRNAEVTASTILNTHSARLDHLITVTTDLGMNDGKSTSDSDIFGSIRFTRI